MRLSPKALLWLVPILLVATLLWIGVDVVRATGIKRTTAVDAKAKAFKNPIDDIMIALEEGEAPDYSRIGDTLEYLRGRYDTADFRLPSIIRILYGHESELPPAVADAMKETVTGFKYWMDQGGSDSMCYWSENHQLLFSSGEYLLGNFYADEPFSALGVSGREHAELGKRRVLTWLEQRFLYGFTEWYSSTYYVEDIAPLAVLIDFAPDEEVRVKASMVMDLLVYDLATQNFKGTFTANSGRMYEGAKMSGRNGSMKEVVSLIWPDYNRYLQVKEVRGMDANFKYLKNYRIPEVLRKIGYDQADANVIRASNGVDLAEYGTENLVGLEDRQVMMQFASEAFTNPEVIANTVRYAHKRDLFTNEFLYDLRIVDIGFLKAFGLLPAVSRLLEPMHDGVAIQRANTYMYRTPDFAMSTAQAYHPGMPGDQQSLFSLTVNNDVNIFLQNPAASLKPDGALGNSPNYWVGNGYHPHTVQEKNVNLSLWVLPEKVNALGKLAGLARKINPYTHAYFPSQYADEISVEGNYAFARFGDVFVALVGKNGLRYKPFAGTAYDEKMKLTDEYDLIQEGRETWWVTEAANARDYADFASFKSAIRAAPVSYADGKLSYRNLSLAYRGAFTVDGTVSNLEYGRFDSRYSRTPRKSPAIRFEFGGDSLLLDFYALRREF